jgi:dihydrofolate reductase
MVLVAAVADNGVIARDGALPWVIPEDSEHYVATVRHHAVLMGRRTYDEMGGPMPDCTNIVLTRDRMWRGDDVRVAHDIATALEVAAASDHGDKPLMVIGGAQVFALALEAGAEEQVLTEVHLSPEGDTRYPDFDRSEWSETRREPHLDAPVPFEFVWLRRSD